MKLTAKKIVEITNGTLYCGDGNTSITHYSKDTRTLNKYDAYIGIKGENFDGNTLYKDAFSKGASACILEAKSFIKDDNYNYDKPIILVNNARDALKDIAVYIRDNSNAKFICVTGSVGKTSTRDMIYSVVREQDKSIKTEGNLNTDIGVAMTLMEMTDEKYAVIEIAMDKFGEIDYLSRMVKPQIGVITNVGTAHIGNLGSRENILKAKMEIRNGITSDGILIINNDNDLLHDYYLNNKEGLLTIGIYNDSDIMAKDIKTDDNGSSFKIIYKNNEYLAECPIASEAFIYNSLEAFAVGILLNIPVDKILKGIKNFELTQNRLEIKETSIGARIINDTYNASFDSMKSSLEILKNSSGNRKIAVLGDMLELGEYSKEIHEKTGKCVKDNNIDILVTVGENAKYIKDGAIVEGMNKENIYSFDTNKEAIELLKQLLKKDDLVLIKASHGMNFIEIVNNLQ